MAESFRTPLLGSRIQLCSAGRGSRSNPDNHSPVSHPRHACVTSGIEQHFMDAAARLGHRLFPLGLGGRPLAADNPRPVWLFALLTVFSLAFGLTTWTSSVLLGM